jgi:hypothetical protein
MQWLIVLNVVQNALSHINTASMLLSAPLTSKTLQCIIREPLLHNILPSLIDMSYETYLQKKRATVYMLRDLQVHGRFTVNEDNIVSHLELGEEKEKLPH